ncbi:MAG: hypothetical protein E7460_00135 [Ruminococcaceae bacterium]|nr:hypothetical protein [Oscillospiraceae bacterium]
MRNLVLDPQKLPIRFTLGNGSFSGMPDGCFARREGDRIVYTATLGDVEIKADCVAYSDFDASEWTVYFTNRGTSPSPVLRDVYAIYNVFPGENNKIYTCNGDYCSADGYSTAETHLSCGGELVQTPRGGRSCDGAFPYQRLLFDGHGHNFAIGWPGQWQSGFKATADGVLFWARQEKFASVILPGETLRTPLIVAVSFEGGLEKGINVWRRWYLAHVGTAKPYLVGCYKPAGTLEFTHATEENLIARIRRMKENGINCNLWWLDAGWYPAKNDDGEDDWWGTLGEWKCDPERFPNGLAPVGEECEKQGLDFLLWFEAERVTKYASVVTEHPEWIISTPENPHVMMLDLSRDDCCDYLTKKIGDIIEEGKIKIYRQDYNFEPLEIWHENDAADRIGSTENLYVQNYLRFWDSLKQRFPGLVIDSCASGGRRNDIETMRRSVPLHETDFGYGNHPVLQSFMQTLYTWIPYFRGFNSSEELADGAYPTERPDDNGPRIRTEIIDEFRDLSNFAPCLHFGQFAMADRITEEEYAYGREICDLFYRVAPVLCTADFYALTPYHKSRFCWTAWQFDLPEEGRGILQVIRNNAAPKNSLTVLPRLAPGDYRFVNLRTGEEFTAPAGEVTFSQPIRSASLWEYKKI